MKVIRKKTRPSLGRRMSKGEHLLMAFYMSGFFHLFYLQISGSKFQGKSLSSQTDFKSLFPVQRKLQPLAFWFDKYPCPWPSSSLEEKWGGRKGQVKGEERVGVSQRCHIPHLLFTGVHQCTMHRATMGQREDTCHPFFHFIAPDPFWSCHSSGLRLLSLFSFGFSGVITRKTRKGFI